MAKRTVSTRRLTNQRLAELYGLDPSIPVFRVLRKLWDRDAAGRPLLAIQCAIARDPLLAATAPAILALALGPNSCASRCASPSVKPRRPIQRSVFLRKCFAMRRALGLSPVTSKVARLRNADGFTQPAITWPLVLFLAHCAGFRGQELFSCGWMQVLDLLTVCSARTFARR